MTKNFKMSSVLVAGSMAASLTLLAACGDDGNSAGAVEYSQSAKISVDETAQTMVLTISEDLEYCVADREAMTLSWKNFGTETAEIIYDYKFFGDTLVFFKNGSSGSSMVMIGGKAGSIYGTWYDLDCEYYRDEMECYDDFDKATAGTYEISRGGITYSRKGKNYNDRDYLYSEFTMDVARFVAGDGWGVYADDGLSFEDEEYVERVFERLGIQVVSHGGKNVSLNVKGNNLNVSVKSARRDMNGEEFSATVSMNGKSCSAMFAYEEVNRNNCRTENMDLIDDFYNEEFELNGVEYVVRVAEGVVRQNEDEFYDCMHAMVNTGSSGDDIDVEFVPADTDGYDVIYKQAAAKDSKKEIRKRILKNRAEFIKAIESLK